MDGFILGYCIRSRAMTRAKTRYTAVNKLLIPLHIAWGWLNIAETCSYLWIPMNVVTGG